MKSLYDIFSKEQRNILLWWPFFILYYLILRVIFGLEYFVIYSFVLTLIFLRISFEISALIFFIIGLIAYLLNLTVEANHYMSFVYGFMGLSLIKYLYIIVSDRLNSQ